MDPIALLVPIVALTVGFFAAWALRGRALARSGERLSTAEEMRNAALRDLALAEQRAQQAAEWRGTAERATLERDSARAELSAIKAEQRARAEAYEAQIATLKEAREQLSLQFGEVGRRLLDDAQKTFLERAEQRFGQSQEQSRSQMKALLDPVEAVLKRYEEGLGRVEKDRHQSYAALREQVEQLRIGTAETRAETQKLVHALRNAPKARGRWGEHQLRNVLEMAGLSEHADFQTEVSVGTEDGRLRPDVIVRLPGGRQLVIDAKCSLNAYLDAADAADEATRAAHLSAHAGAIRTHAQQLGAKEYQTRFGEAADYVVMFIPGEHFLTAALEQDGALWEWAFQKRVLIATPTNLVAIARTVASVWRQEKLAEDAREIARLGKEMYERVGVAAGHLRKMGDGLNAVVGNYNRLVGSMETRVLSTARKFRDLNVEDGGREIEPVEAIDLVARAPEGFAAAEERPALLFEDTPSPAE